MTTELRHSLPRGFRKRFVLACILFFSVSARCQKTETPKSECPVLRNEFDRLEKRAKAGNPQAQTVMASCYELGRNVKPNGLETIRWLKLAADQGYAPAEYELGRMYLYGRGIPADYQQALLWETKASLQGERSAQRDLAFMYERGLGVPADPREATVWNRMAAEQGEPQAQLHLAEALETGRGVPEDPAEARVRYLKAARQGVARAQLKVAQIYAADAAATCQTALVWYGKAAAGGETQAMYESGKLYQTAKCGPDLWNAFVWLRIGGRFGSKESQSEAEKVASSLSPAQKKSAELRIERWIKKHSGAQKEEDEKEKEER